MSSKKKLTKNIIYNGIYQIFILLTPIITVPYVTRIFTADDLGVNSYTLSIVQVFVTLSFFGLNQYGGREIAFATTKKERNHTFWEIWLLQITMSLLSYMMFLLVIPMIAEQYTPFLYIQGFLILFNMLEVSWFFIGIEEFKNVVLRNTTVKILITSLIFIIIRDESQLWLYMTLNILGVFIGNLTLILSLKKKISKPIINIEKLKKHLRGSLIFLIPQLSILVYNTVDKTILGSLADIDQVAFYEQSKRIIGIAAGFITSASVVMLPRMSSLKSLGKSDEFDNLFSQGLQYTLFFSFYVVAGVIAVSPSFVHWFFGPSFVTIVPMMQLVSFLGLTTPLSMLIGNALLLPMKKEKIIVRAAIYAAIISVVINLALDSFLGAWGAIIAILLVDFIAMLYRFYHAKKIYDFKQEQVHFMQLLISFLVSTIITFIVNQFLPTVFGTTVVSGLLVSILFFGLLLVMKNKVLIELIKKILLMLKAM